MIRRWWNRWLVRVGWVEGGRHGMRWTRSTIDVDGWHSSYRLRRGGDHEVTSDWLCTHRWYDSEASEIPGARTPFDLTLGDVDLRMLIELDDDQWSGR